MTKEEWEDLLQRLPEPNAADAVFGIHEGSGQSKQGFIRANREGIELVAGELLRCLRNTEEAASTYVPGQLPVSYPEVFSGGDLIPEYIELVDRNEVARKPDGDNVSGLKQKAAGAGCLLLLLFLGVSMLVGTVTIIRWLF